MSAPHAPPQSPSRTPRYAPPPPHRGRLRVGLLAALALAAPACSDDPPSLTAAQQAQFAPYIADAPPPNMIPADVDFDGKVHLIGYIISPRQAIYGPGTKLNVLLIWRCDQRLESGWKLFTHLVGETGEMIQSIDDNGPLRKMSGVEGQPFPPSQWQPGKLYVDSLSFIVPGDPSPTLVVAAGIAKGEARLPIRGEGGDKENRASVVRLRTGVKNPRLRIKDLAVPKLPPDTAIAIDGRLDEPAWAAAPRTGAFVDVNTGRESRSLPTHGHARVLWDDAFLYIGFEVQDRKVAGGWPAGAADPHLWEKDTVEIMIDPDGDGDNKDYYEIQINPQNLVFDSQFDDYNLPRGGPAGPFGHEAWSAGLTSAVQVNGTMDNDADVDEGYTVEAKIPWASFAKAQRAPPAFGDAWRMNFYAMQNNGGSAWSPIYGEGNFHRARRFGRVRFLPPAGQAAPSSSASAASSAAPSAKPPPPPSAKAPPPPSAKAPAPPPPSKVPGVKADPPDR